MASNCVVSATRELLLRWHEGDQEAMATLVRQESAFVASQVRKRLGPLLRREHDTQDIVQSTLLQALRAAPRFLVSDRDKLRGLLVRMVENALRVQAGQQLAQKRDIRREVQLQAASPATVLDLDPPDTGTNPAAAAERTETRDWVRLALELLDHQDRTVILLRDYEELTFGEIAARLGAAEDTIRMRHRRAMPKLANTLMRLQRGELDRLL
ncbi:MAG TPA: sigma-70 family RNA polymerase sigma factor [Planctomycetota bacterium]|nr:sigma-70 family RNA polymerase sigma factor [Planctomycetota bacterium]